MAILKIAEIFGYAVENSSSAVVKSRAAKWCPFRDRACTKSSKIDPVGVCSLSDGKNATILCPVRFREGDRIFIDAAAAAFGAGTDFAVVPEVRILRVEDEEGAESKIGKVDYLLARLTKGRDRVADFAALEVQGVYFSGREIKTPMKHFLAQGKFPIGNEGRRPDYRSSAQKRLMPQLRLKVPVFRRWGKKFFVAVDSLFFAALPKFRETKQANTEVTWLSYPFVFANKAYGIGTPRIFYSEFEDVLTALREGEAPEPDEIVAECERRLASGAGLRILKS